MDAQAIYQNKYNVVNNESTSTVDVFIDGYIVDAPTQELLKAFWGDETSVSYKSVRDEINKSNPKVVNYYINSGGGQVTDAMAIHDFNLELESKGVTVNRYGRGLIASAATYILMGKNSEISKNSWFMIHNVSGAVWGDVNQIEGYARTMRKFNNRVRDFYVEHTGNSTEQVDAWMNEETWFDGNEAVEKGFVNKTTDYAEFTNSIDPEKWPFSNKMVLNKYNANVNNKNSNNMDIDKIVNLVVEKLGFSNSDNKPKQISKDDMVNALKEGFANINTEIETEVNNAVDAAIENLSGDKGTLSDVIANAVKVAFENGLKEDGAIVTAMNTALEGYATSEDLENLTEEVSKKIGNKVTKKPKKEGAVEDKNDHPGINWNNSEDDDDEEDE